MFTTRNIKKGEELCDCYSDVIYHEPAWIRQIFLKEKYNFDCQCEACASPIFEREESDATRIHLKEIATTLSMRIGATFLYNEQFSREVQQITGEDDSYDDYEDWGERAKVCPNKSKMRPTSEDLYNLSEYIQLLQKEGIDHDILECMELAFDLSEFLNDKIALEQHRLGYDVLKLYEIAKGEKHKETRRFRKKLAKSKKQLC
jgi:hypothetical protein